MSDWIVDRLPTEADADAKGFVGTDLDGLFQFVAWQNIKRGDPWYPIPKPYVPPKPEPDTSLAASIHRFEFFRKYGDDDYYDSTLIDDDVSRIIEAARNWDKIDDDNEIADLQQRLEQSEHERNSLNREVERLAKKADKWDEHQSLVASLVESDANAIADICGSLPDSDASLAASIEHVKEWLTCSTFADSDPNKSPLLRDLTAVIEAARKTLEVEQQIADDLDQEFPKAKDTSLAESISFYERMFAGGGCHTTGRDYEVPTCTCIVCCKHRILEAAREWDARRRVCEAESAFSSLDDPRIIGSNDPDGVGEGWRLLGKDECPDRKLSDELSADRVNWKVTSWKGNRTCDYINKEYGIRFFRRRIETPEQSDGLDHKSPLAAKMVACQQPAEPQ
jgi:hypothetical protein